MAGGDARWKDPALTNALVCKKDRICGGDELLAVEVLATSVEPSLVAGLA